MAAIPGVTGDWWPVEHPACSPGDAFDVLAGLASWRSVAGQAAARNRKVRATSRAHLRTCLPNQRHFFPEPETSNETQFALASVPTLAK